MSKINLNNANFYYELHGSGHPLVLISGYCCDHLFWKPILKPLSEYFQVLIFDNRAVGQTTDEGHSISAASMADDVIALIDALHLKKPHIVGQSMGGTIAQTIGARYGDKISKLVLMNSSPKWRLATLHALTCHIKMLEEQVPFEILFQSILCWLFGETFLHNDVKIANFKKSLLENPFPQTLENQRRQFEVLPHFDGIAQLKSITAKTLILHGEEDILALLSEAQMMADQIPNSQLINCPCAHGCVAEIPEQLIQILTNFLL